MSLYLSCAWDHARIGAAALRFTTASGTYAISITTGRRAHISASTLALMGTGGLTYTTGIEAGSFATQLQTLMDAAAPETVTVTRSASTALYTLACTGATFSIDFSTDGAAGTRMRQILGMTANRTGALTYSSWCYPKYLLVPQRSGRTAYTGVKTVTSGMRTWKTDAGAMGSLSPTYLPRMSRWEHHFEAEGHVWHRMADADSLFAGHQYTWEALSEDAYQLAELCFVEDSVTPMESFGFYLSSSPVGEELRPIRPEMRRFVVPIETQVMGLLP